MSENKNISSLFDRSGNLSPEVMELYLRGGLSHADRVLVEKHLAESDFDREALEGMQKHISEDFRKEIVELQAGVRIMARKDKQIRRIRVYSKNYWYAAAGLAGIICLSVVLFFMFRSPAEKPQLAVARPDTVHNNTTVAVVQDEKRGVTEEPLVPELRRNETISMQVNPEPESSPDKTDIVNEIVQHDVIQESESLEPSAIIDAESAIAENAEVPGEQPAGGVALNEDVESPVKMADDQEEVMMEYSEMKTKSALTGRNTIMPASAPDTSEKQVFMVVETMPEFPGGDEALFRFLNDSIQYPAAAIEKKIHGRVYVTFVVTEDGSVTDARVLRGIGGGCDEEALRVVMSMPKWIPGRQRGVPVRVQYNLPIKFTLSK